MNPFFRLWWEFTVDHPRRVSRKELPRTPASLVPARHGRAPGVLPSPRGWRAWYQHIKDFIYGATLFEMVEEIRRERARREELMVLLLFGTFLGVPVIPPYPALRLIPYIIPHLGTWRRQMLREKDFTELLDHEMG